MTQPKSNQQAYLILKSSLLMLVLCASNMTFGQGEMKYYLHDDAGNRNSRSITIVGLADSDDEDRIADNTEDPTDKSLDIEQKAMDALEPEIKVYPNPAYGLINIDIPSDEKEQLTLTVQDLSGKQVLRDTQQNTGNNQLDISILPPGEYVLTLQSPTRLKSWSILKN